MTHEELTEVLRCTFLTRYWGDLISCPVKQFEAQVTVRRFRTHGCVGSIAAVMKEKQTYKTLVIHREYIVEYRPVVDTNDG